MDGLVVKYASVGGLLRKVEEAVVGTATGKAPALAGKHSGALARLYEPANPHVLCMSARSGERVMNEANIACCLA